jgi:hypothetical protein
VTAVEGDCRVADDTPRAWRAVMDDDPVSGGRSFAFMLNARCAAGPGAPFDCSAPDADATVTFPVGGHDVTETVTWGLEATDQDADHLVGTLTRDVTCEGDACSTAAAPEPTCSTTFRWTAERVADEPGWPLSMEAEPTAFPGEHGGLVGAAPWDPLLTRVTWMDEGQTGAPTVVGGADPVATEPLVVAGVFGEEQALYRPVKELEPGGYRLARGAFPAAGHPIAASGEGAALTQPPWQVADAPEEAGTVEAFGRDASFAPAALVGGRWLLEASPIAFPQFAVALGGGESVHLEVEAADADSATFRLVATDVGTGTECVLLRDRGALSTLGVLTWSRERVDVDAKPEPIALYSPSLRLGFSADGARIAGAEASLLADLRSLSTNLGEGCASLDVVDVRCVPCPDDGSPNCTPLAAFAWTGERVDDAIDPDLPWCGADFTQGDEPTWQLDCGSGPACALGGPLLVVPWALRRRRRGARRRR